MHPVGTNDGTEWPLGSPRLRKIFQMKLGKLADDILTTGQGKTGREAYEDHDRNLKSLLDRCSEWNIKLNKSKFIFLEA